MAARACGLAWEAAREPQGTCCKRGKLRPADVPVKHEDFTVEGERQTKYKIRVGNENAVLIIFIIFISIAVLYFLESKQQLC